MHYALLGLGLVAVASAADHQRHAHLHKKHDHDNSWSAEAASSTACGCKTYTTTWYGEATLVPSTSTSTSSSSSTSTSVWTSTSSSTWVAPTTTSTSETPSSTWVPPPSTTETPSSTWVAPESSAAPSSSAAWSSGWSAPASDDSTSNNGGGLLGALLPSISLPAAAAPSGGSSSAGSISTDGDKWAMTYTPYDNSGGCKSASDVASDIQSIKDKGFTTVRLYATDCSGVENVGAACLTTGLKMIMGIYIDAGGLSTGYPQISQLTSWGQSNGWDHVEMVVAGNEAIFNNYVTASELAGFIGDVKSQFSAAGFTGPVTTTEPLDIIQQNSDVICGAVDVIAANIHPFFNSATDAAGAGAFVSSQLSILAGTCGNSKTAYNLETGWPSAGDANGDAVPGVLNQQIAVESIVNAAGSKSAIFSFENDGWKAPGSLGVEQFWGCSSLFPDIF